MNLARLAVIPTRFPWVVWCVDRGWKAMMVVKVELWPGGIEAAKQDLGTAYITNDGTGTADIGNYDVRLGRMRGRGVWRTGRVEGFKRKILGPWDLLCLALAALVGKRIGITLLRLDRFGVISKIEPDDFGPSEDV
jgi:hypothetical protein